MRAAGVVLCGGRSSRMGRPKAWLAWRGRPLLVHVVERLRPLVDEVVVVASEELELPPLEARVVRDRQPALGPLAGIREGLAHARAELAYVTAADAPYLEGAFVETLLSFGRAAALELDGHVQTLAAVYPSAGLAVAEELIAAGRMRPLFLLEALGYRKLSPEEVPDTASIQGFNTPAEYLAAVRAEDPDASATLEFLGRARMLAGIRELRVPVGTLGELLAHAPPELGLVCGGRVAKHYLASLDGRSFVRDLSVPVGAGEQVVVLDASVGG